MTRVLIVEDEPSFVEAIRVSLEREGFTVDSAADGRRGLERFRETRPDVVLLDLMLPGIGGLDVLRAIRRDSDVPVIVVSAKDAEADIVSALELGADDYVTKPYSIRELLARMRAATRRRSTLTGGAISVGNATLDRDASASASATSRSTCPARSSRCCRSSWSNRAGWCPARSSWTRCGASPFSATPAASTSTSAASAAASRSTPEPR